MKTRRSWLAQFASQCADFAVRDAATATFGWATVPSGALGGMGYWGLQTSPSPDYVLLYPLVGAGAAWVIAFLVNLFVLAPFKAYRVMEPFVLSINDTIVDPDCVHNAHEYTVTLIIKNRSSRHLIDCQVHICSISGIIDPTLFPRFVDKFDLPPSNTKSVGVAYWSSREPPYCDDTEIGISGPMAPVYDGNILRIGVSDYIFTIRTRVPDSRSKEVRCHLWVDSAARRLRAEILNG